MELTTKETKFLTILNETRISGGKLMDGFSKKIKEHFSYTNSELNGAIAKLKGEGYLSELDLGGDEVMYFFTEKVDKDMLDKDLGKIKN